MARVSSLSRAPNSSELPSASAAHTNARFVMLFDPGGRTVALTGPVGWISTVSLTPFVSRRSSAESVPA